MIRRLLLLASLFAASSAFATWNPSFSSRHVELTVGETTVIELRAVWSGLAFPDFHRWVCISSRESVAHVEGVLNSPSHVAEVRITGIAPGEAWVHIEPSSGRLVHILVYPTPVSVAITRSAPTSIVGRPLTLTATTEGSPHTIRWFEGRLGDVSRPLESGSELTVRPTRLGLAYYWVLAADNHTESRAEIAIDVKTAPRQRAVRH